MYVWRRTIHGTLQRAVILPEHMRKKVLPLAHLSHYSGGWWLSVNGTTNNVPIAGGTLQEIEDEANRWLVANGYGVEG